MIQFYAGIIPLYLFTLGDTKLPDSTHTVPYPMIGLYISYTIFPLLLGILIKCGIHCLCPINPKKFFVTILRWLSLLYIISITGYAIASVLDLLAPSALDVSWRVWSVELVLSIKIFSMVFLLNFSSIWPDFCFQFVVSPLHHWSHLCASKIHVIVLQSQPKQ